jgi:hypothetical protein
MLGLEKGLKENFAVSNRASITRKIQHLKSGSLAETIGEEKT